MALNKSIFATLFPHLKPENNPIASIAPAPNVSDMALGANVAGDGDGAPFDYAQAAEMQNRINYDAASADAAPPIAAAPAESINQTLTKPLVPVDFSELTRRIAGSAAPAEKTEYDTAKDEYNRVAAAKPEKQKAWKQALWIALQGANKFFNPQDNTPVEWLGEAKHNRQLQKAAARLSPLQQLENQRKADALAQIKAQKEQEEMRGLQITNEGKIKDNRGKEIDNINSRAKDYLATLKDTNHITEEQAATLRELTQLPYKAADWRKVIRFNDQGVPYITREGEEGARPDSSLNVDQSEIIRERNIGKNKFFVNDKTALGGQISTDNANAGRQQSAAQFELKRGDDLADKEYSSQKDYDVATMNWRRDKATATGKYNGAKAMLASAQKNRDDLKAQNYDTAEADKQMIQAQKDMDEAEPIMNLPRPKKIIRSGTGNNARSGSKSSSSYQDAVNKVRNLRH